MKYSDAASASDNYSLESIHTAHDDRVGSSCIIDLRRHPRIDTWFKAQMIYGSGRVDGFISDLSRSGLCFEAGGELTDLLMSGNGQHTSQASRMVEICFDVPMENSERRPVIVQARTVYISGDDEGKYRCGTEFRVFTEGERALEDYLCIRGVTK